MNQLKITEKQNQLIYWTMIQELRKRNEKVPQKKMPLKDSILKNIIFLNIFLEEKENFPLGFQNFFKNFFF